MNIITKREFSVPEKHCDCPERMTCGWSYKLDIDEPCNSEFVIRSFKTVVWYMAKYDEVKSFLPMIRKMTKAREAISEFLDYSYGKKKLDVKFLKKTVQLNDDDEFGNGNLVLKLRDTVSDNGYGHMLFVMSCHIGVIYNSEKKADLLELQSILNGLDDFIFNAKDNLRLSI